MNSPKTIFVTGATGNQGGSVAKALLANGFRVKALTRNPDSAPAQYLKSIQAQIIEGDLNNPETFKQHLEGVDGLFSVQAFTDGVDKEIKQGCALVDLGKEYGVPHFLYTSVSGADIQTGIPHWESKYRIEQYLRTSGLSFTIIRPASLFENFIIPQVSSRIKKDKLVTPVRGDKVQQFISAADVGNISVPIFLDSEKYRGATITLAAEQMDHEHIASLFSEVLGRPIRYQKLPSIITRLFMGKDLFKMFSWINSHDAVFIKDLEAFKKEYPGLMSLKEWININRSSFE